MRTINTLLVAVFCLISISGIQAQVKSDFDKDTDFTKYETYSFAGWEKNTGEIINDIDQQRIVDAVVEEMNRRGLQQVEEGGDLKVTGFVVLEQQTSTTSYTTFNGGMGMSPGWGWGMGPGMSGMTTQYEESDYTEGTMVLDMYDGDTGKLVWQGVEQEVVKTKPSRREKQIPKIIGNIMTEFPISLSN